MGKASKALTEFIEDIPDDKLTGFPDNPGTMIYTTKDFRLDMQGLTTPINGKRNYNLQIQINKQTTITTLAKIAPETVSTALVPVDPPFTAAQVRQELSDNREL